MKKKKLTRAGGRWTEARYTQFISSALRKAFLKYPVKQDVLESNRREYNGPEKNRWEYLCASCKEWYFGTEVQVDHITPVGSMDDMNRVVATLFCEKDNLQILCKSCHKAKKTYDRPRSD